MKPKIAFVVQRYGEEINGGAELHCKLLAERLTDNFNIEVFTSCAQSYVTWFDYYPSGESIINGIKVFRFPTYNKKSARFYWIIRKKNRLRKILILLIELFSMDKLKWGKETILRLRKHIFEGFIEGQGPYLPNLIDCLSEKKDDYKVIFFFTYLYYPTVKGIRIAPQKSILVPTAHDEPAIRNPYFSDVFNLPATIIYNTKQEKDFVNSLFNNRKVRSIIAGVGISLTDESPFIDIRPKYSIQGDYILYVGRIDENKGCNTLIDYFIKYKEKNRSNLKLLMVGKLFMPTTAHPDIIFTGFVDEQIKINAIKQSCGLIMPSLYESLSMVTLEAMYLETPVIVNGRCEVLKSHVVNSGAGFCYNSFKEFEEAVTSLIKNKKEVELKGIMGKTYVEENYNWESIITKINREIIDLGKVQQN